MIILLKVLTKGYNGRVMKRCTVIVLAALLAMPVFSQTAELAEPSPLPPITGKSSVKNIDGAGAAQPLPYWGVRLGSWLDQNLGLSTGASSSKGRANANGLQKPNMPNLNMAGDFGARGFEGLSTIDWPSKFTTYFALGSDTKNKANHLQKPRISNPNDPAALKSFNPSAIGGAAYSLSESWSVFSEIKTDYLELDKSPQELNVSPNERFKSEFLNNTLNIGISLSF